MNNNWQELDLNQQRNEVNLEFNKLVLLLKETKEMFSIPTTLDIKNYDSVKDEKMTEEEYLKLMYDEIQGIRETLLTLVYYLGNNVDMNKLKEKMEQNNVKPS